MSRILVLGLIAAYQAVPWRLRDAALGCRGSSTMARAAIMSGEPPWRMLAHYGRPRSIGVKGAWADKPYP